MGPAEVGKRFGVPITSDTGTRRYNIAPLDPVLTLVSEDGTPAPRIMRWGLLPAWAIGKNLSYELINARLEGLRDTGKYAGIAPEIEHRALMPATGYFEWKHFEDSQMRPLPYYYHLEGEEPFAFPAICTEATVNGVKIQSASLLTCSAQANEIAAAVHHRMPVLLTHKQAQQAWLDPTLSGREALAVCEPLPDGRLRVQAANPAINKPGATTERPELLAAP